MKLYLIQGTERGYDTYDSAIVAAKNEDDARLIHPSEYAKHPWSITDRGSWADKPDDVTVTLIGTPIRGTKRGVILASFNAG